MQDVDGPRTSPVQRAWLIDEVVRNILAHVPLVGSSKTLANCARVSTALSEPALDMLWSRVTGLSPLCQLLDASSVDEHTSHLSPTVSLFPLLRQLISSSVHLWARTHRSHTMP